jgi:hypothetical protein
MRSKLWRRLYRYTANSTAVINSNVEDSCTTITAWTLPSTCKYYIKPMFCVHIMAFLFKTPCSLVNGYHLQSGMLPPPSDPPIEQHHRRPVHQLPSPCTPHYWLYVQYKFTKCCRLYYDNPAEYLTRKDDVKSEHEVPCAFWETKYRSVKS